MREIKFRVWEKIEKRWLSSPCGHQFGEPSLDYHSYKIDLCSCLQCNTNAKWYNIPSKYEIQQFTGLLDKNSREIYEGDIVSIYFNGSKETILAEIVFTRGFFGWRRTSDWIPLFSGLNEMSSVVGNVFENPELLKKSPRVIHVSDKIYTSDTPCR